MRTQRTIRDLAGLEVHHHVAWWGDGSAAFDRLATEVAAAAGGKDKVLVVADDPRPERLAPVDGLDRLLGSGQLECKSVDAVYRPGRPFDLAAQLEAFEEVVRTAVGEGYQGVRVVADNTSLAGDDGMFSRWLAWEELTDRFQATWPVAGVCFFDRRRLADADRHEVLACVHPVLGGVPPEPPFRFYSEGRTVRVTGSLDAFSAGQFRRVLAAAPDDAELVVDLSDLDFIDHRALLELARAATAARPVRLQHSPRLLRRLLQVLDLPAPHLILE